jgi:glycosyltransferase involved in cell wall biosynthesis
MKILLLCKKFPYPLKDGESIAIYTLAKAFNELGCEVSLLAMNTRKHRYSASSYPAALDFFKEIRTVEVDNRVKPSGAFRNLFSRASYHITRFESTAFRQVLEQMLRARDYDVIQLETLYLAPYISTIRTHSAARIAMRAHNVEHEIWQRLVTNSSPGIKRWYIQYLTQKLRRYEIESLDQYDYLVPITPRDLQHFRRLGASCQAVVTPIGLDTKGYQADYSSYSRPPSLSFIGSLDWMPNVEGLHWFLTKIWPQLHARYPQLKLHVAGRNTPESLQQQQHPQVVIHGEVADARDFINQHSFMMVPLLSGSGMRAKILEGMALGKVVCTTSIGLEGIDAHHREEVLVANTPEQFMSVLAPYLEQPAKAEQLGQRAQELVQSNYDYTELTKRLVDAYNEQTAVTVLPTSS